MGENERQAGASYIVDFYKELNDLNQDTASYINYVGALNTKYAGSDTALPDDELNPLLTLTQNLKNHIFKSFIMAVALTRKSKDLDTSKLKKPYDLIKEQTIPKIDDVELYAIELNAFFCAGVMGDILIKANSFIGGLNK